MPVPAGRPLQDEVCFGGTLVDVSSPSIVYAPVPITGVVVDAGCSISAATTLADSIVTIKAIKSGAAAVTLGTITVAFTGSAIGSCFQANMSGTEEARSVNAYTDTIVFDSDGAGTTTSIASFNYVIRRT